MTGWDIRVVLHPLSLCGSTYSVQVALPQYDLKLCRWGVKQIQMLDLSGLTERQLLVDELRANLGITCVSDLMHIALYACNAMRMRK